MSGMSFEYVWSGVPVCIAGGSSVSGTWLRHAWQVVLACPAHGFGVSDR